MRGLWAVRFSVALVLLFNGQIAEAQEAAADSFPAGPADSAQAGSPDSAQAGPADLTNEVLTCAWEIARSAGFETQLSISGRVLHVWRPHLHSMDTNETDYVRVWVYGRGRAKGFRWEVKAYTITGRAPITTSVLVPRPPSRDADRLRRSIEKTCAPNAGASD
jgi:hypothetical protein